MVKNKYPRFIGKKFDLKTYWKNPLRIIEVCPISVVNHKFLPLLKRKTTGVCGSWKKTPFSVLVAFKADIAQLRLQRGNF